MTKRILIGTVVLLWNSGCVRGMETIPDAGLEVQLARPINEHVLFSTVEAMAKDAGFSYYYGVGVAGNKGGDNYEGRLDLHDWYMQPTVKSDDGNYSINVAWNHYHDDVTYFEFILYNSSTRDFRLQEWRMFAEWRDRLEEEFPMADIKILRHPGEHTATGNLASFSEETGIPLFGKHRARIATSLEPE